MTNDNTDSLVNSVNVVGKPWKDSAYYANAEKWTFMFWQEGTVFKRMFDKLDISILLELACGHGRHACETISLSNSIILMDIFEENIRFCQNRLRTHTNIKYIQGNGYSFYPVEDSTVTAIFSYDSMVHFSSDLVKSYLIDAKRILKPGGMILLHHSNYCVEKQQHYGLNPFARNHMTYELFRSLANEAGVVILESMPITWGRVKDLDRITLLKKPITNVWDS